MFPVSSHMFKRTTNVLAHLKFNNNLLDSTGKRTWVSRNGEAVFDTTLGLAILGSKYIDTSLVAMSDYTLEFSLYLISYNGTLMRADNGGDYLNVGIASSSSIWFYGMNMASTLNLSMFPLNRQFNLCVQRYGNVGSIFVDQIRIWTGTVGTGGSDCHLEVGGAHDLSSINGYIREVRISNIARYPNSSVSIASPW